MLPWSRDLLSSNALFGYNHQPSRVADAGALMTYGVSFADIHRRSAMFVEKIVKGANPADMPVEQPTKFDLAINIKTAKQLGIDIPSKLLFTADEVIE